jgi:RecA-family ATPase
MTDFSGFEDIRRRWTGNGHDPTGPLEPLLPFDPTRLDGIPVPERPWLVPGWIPRARVTGFYGGGGEGKTTLAQQLATCCALGRPWLDLPTEQGRSLLFFCEDDLDEMHRRQHDINRAYGCNFTDLGGMHWLPRLGQDNALMTFELGRPRHTALYAQLLSSVKDLRSTLIITDTLADVFSGNENDRSEARAFAQQALGLLARETQGAVVALAHPSKAGENSGSGYSGSTAWVGTFRSQLYLSTPKGKDDSDPPDPDLRSLARRKSNAARRDDEIRLRWDDGVFVAVSPAPGGLLDLIEQQDCEQLFLEFLEQAERSGRRLSDSKHAANTWTPRVFAQDPRQRKFRVKAFGGAMARLFATGRIEMLGKGRDRRMVVRRREGPPGSQGSL